MRASRTATWSCALAALTLATGQACAQGGGTAMNTLTPEEEAAGWQLLFDGQTTAGWQVYGRGGMSEGWQAIDGLLAHVGNGGDIVADGTFGDFELSLEWKLDPGGNSGVFYRAAEGSRRIYHSAPEMQVVDDERHADGRNPLTSAGSNYGLHAPTPGVVKPAGEWNHARIVVRGNHVEHWLNSVRVVQYELGSPEWSELVANSKFAEWPEYGLAKEGQLGLQDHGDPVWYRNIKVRPLS